MLILRFVNEMLLWTLLHYLTGCFYVMCIFNSLWDEKKLMNDVITLSDVTSCMKFDIFPAFPTMKTKKITPPRPVELIEEQPPTRAREPPVFILSGMQQAVSYLILFDSK